MTSVIQRPFAGGAVAADATANATVTCLAGERAVGGGFSTGGNPNLVAYQSAGWPTGFAAGPITGWTTYVRNTSSEVVQGWTAYVACAS